MWNSTDPNTMAITVLRIVVGLFFVIFGEYKVFSTEFTLHGGFQEAVKGFISGGAYPFMVPILHGILVHFATAMAFAVAYGEFLIGVSLLIGVWSRIASGCGFVLMMSMWLSGGYPGASAAFWRYWGASLDWSVLAVCFLLLILGRPEEIWSLRNWRPFRSIS
jgi:thiosulfate dehydrogenase [quinone] large subunit